MAVGGDVGVDVEVVEEDEIAGELVVVGGDGFGEEGEGGVAVADAEVA